jgi:hypothetical protein
MYGKVGEANERITHRSNERSKAAEVMAADIDLTGRTVDWQPATAR